MDSQRSRALTKPEILSAGLDVELALVPLGQKRSEADEATLKEIRSHWSESKVILSIDEMVKKPCLVIRDESFSSRGAGKGSIVQS